MNVAAAPARKPLLARSIGMLTATCVAGGALLGSAPQASAAQVACTDLEATTLNATTCQRVIDNSTVWTIPARVTTVDMIIIGGSGGGGTGPAAPDFGAAGGGAGGEVLLKLNVVVTPGTAVPVTIGAGGYGAGQPGVGWGSIDGQDGTATMLLGFTARAGQGGRGAVAGTGGVGGATATKSGGAIHGLNGGGGASFATAGGAGRGTCTDGSGGGGGGMGAPGVTVVGGLFPSGDIYNSYPLSPGGSGGSAQADPTTCTGWRDHQQYAGGGAGLHPGSFAENASIGAGGGGGGGASGYVTGQSHVRHAGGKGSNGSVIIRFLLPSATWQVNYDGNGATSGIAPWPPITHSDGDDVSVLDNTDNLMRIGYLFDGWNTQADGEGTAYEPGDTFEITEDITLYADWRVAPATYTVGYSFLGFTGGTAPADPQSPYEDGDRVTVLENSGNLSREGYSFGGWSTQQDGKGTRYQPGDTFRIRANTALFPVWVKGGGGGGGGTGVPSVPTSVTAVAGNGEIEVSWKPPTDPGGSKVTGYTVTVGRKAGDTCTTGAKGRSCIVDGLADGSYTVTVRAINADGSGAKETIDAVLVPGELGPVRNLRFTMRSAKGTARVAWRPPFFNGGSPVIGYLVKYREVDANEWITLGQQKSTKALLKKVTPSRSYDVWVAPVTTKKTGPQTVITGLIPQLPGAPRNVTVVPSDSRVTVTWTEPLSSGTSAIKSYKVWSSVGRGACTAKADERTCTVTGLKNGTRYSFTVRARNGAGFGKPGISKRVIPGKVPGPARTLTVRFPSPTTAVLDWNKPSSNGGVPVTSYRVTYRADDTPAQQVIVKDTQTRITGLTRGVTYTFTVTAKNSYGYGTDTSLTKSSG